MFRQEQRLETKGFSLFRQGVWADGLVRGENHQSKMSHCYRLPRGEALRTHSNIAGCMSLKKTLCDRANRLRGRRKGLPYGDLFLRDIVALPLASWSAAQHYRRPEHSPCRLHNAPPDIPEFGHRNRCSAPDLGGPVGRRS